MMDNTKTILFVLVGIMAMLCLSIAHAQSPIDDITHNGLSSIDGAWLLVDRFMEISLEIDGDDFCYSLSSDVKSEEDFPAICGKVHVEGSVIELRCAETLYDKTWHLVLNGNEVCMCADRDYKAFVKANRLNTSRLLCKMEPKAPLSPCYDMASLYYMADNVVEILESSAIKKKGGRSVTAVVQKVFKGNVNPGDKISVLVSDAYIPRVTDAPFWDDPTHAKDRESAKTLQEDVSTRSLMFLCEVRKGSYMPLDSGIKRISEQQILAYRPNGRLGPYWLVRQRPELISLAPGQSYTASELEKDVWAARDRVDSFKKACQSRDTGALEAFLPLLPCQSEIRGSRSCLAMEAAEMIVSAASREETWRIFERRNSRWDSTATEILATAVLGRRPATACGKASESSRDDSIDRQNIHSD